MNEAFEARLERFWTEADEESATELAATLDQLLADSAAPLERALFERASLHDFLGDEAAAVPLYRAALDAGLAPPHRTQAVIQLASSLRNVGEVSAAIMLLQAVSAEDPLFPAAQAFLSLALHDDDKPTAALRTALAALAPTLPAYQRAVSFYAGDLTSREGARAPGRRTAERENPEGGSRPREAPGGR
ncbi:tetratricopeptide repeat protein [Microbacterium sp. ET2]|uniref:tetratricopeptide repeat protein n=1 Tax=Microbacterium albipurpureum TaxID=3050384 RepID=UPI00259CEB57|nr:tetratricopeptide repeat protein [Microbacterium sp. ET2 (Ac-2212)]WJL95561.1 tetratricopeptide repeat protein [Microbacterium sp. ET2 (Ac-2212)]